MLKEPKRVVWPGRAAGASEREWGLVLEALGARGGWSCCKSPEAPSLLRPGMGQAPSRALVPLPCIRQRLRTGMATPRPVPMHCPIPSETQPPQTSQC